MALGAARFERRIRFLHALAEEVRTVAKAMGDAEARRGMYLTALAYERMAEHLEHAAEHLSLPITLSPRLSP
jgi:hypothetical protein